MINDQLRPLAATYYFILPIVAIAVGLVVWVLVRTHASPWKRAGLAAGGVFALCGFAVAVGIVYYHSSAAFAASFRFYAYSALAPAPDPSQEPQDPFLAPDGYSGPILTLQEVHKEDGQVRLVRSVTPGFGDYGMYVFSPGKWIVANQTGGAVTVREASQYFSDPSVTETSLWWALTTDLYKGEYSAE